jgi:hypothetical protein
MYLHFCVRPRLTVFVAVLAVALGAPLLANDRDKNAKGVGANAPPLMRVDLNQPDGQILSYRHLAGPTDVVLRGTKLAPNAQVRLKVGSRPGFVELDINRGGVVGLKPAHLLGRDFLTYVLWAVSVDGRASNLGEITFEGDRAIAVNVTTPYQTFWLMVTAEPNYAVVDPSHQVMLYSVEQSGPVSSRAHPIKSELFYFTHYTTYDADTARTVESFPNQLLQARKAVELAARSGVLASDTPMTGLKEESFTRAALAQARQFLQQAEDVYRRNPRSQEVVQFARTAAQSAENARALAMGAVGGLVNQQLRDKISRLEDELARLRPEGASGAEDPERAGAAGMRGVATVAPMPGVAVPLVKQPALWFAIAGWALAIVVLFRRRSV